MKKENNLLGIVVLGICLLAMSPDEVNADECNHCPYCDSCSKAQTDEYNYGPYWVSSPKVKADRCNYDCYCDSCSKAKADKYKYGPYWVSSPKVKADRYNYDCYYDSCPKVKTDECNDNPCYNSCSFGNLNFSADFIYWKPCVDDLDYACVAFEEETSGTSPTFRKNKHTYKCLCLDSEPGFRICFGKDNILCNWNLSGSYLWLNIDSKANHKKQEGTEAFVTSPFFAPFLYNLKQPAGADLTFVKGCYKNAYQNWDVLLSYDISRNKCHSFQPFFGVEGLIFNQKLVIDGFVDKEDEDANRDQVKWTSDYFSVGLKMGTAYVYEFNCFKFYVNAAGTILVGDYEANNKQTRWDQSGNEFEHNFKDNSCCHFVPGIHLALGILYQREACGCKYAIRLGWEVVQWYNISNPKRFYIPVDEGLRTNASASNYTTVGFHGLVAGLDLSF